VKGCAAEVVAGLLIAGTAVYMGAQIVRAHPELVGLVAVLALIAVAMWALRTLLRIGHAMDDRDGAIQDDARRAFFGGHDPADVHGDFEPLPRRLR
jgi:hypothetical protein